MAVEDAPTLREAVELAVGHEREPDLHEEVMGTLTPDENTVRACAGAIEAGPSHHVTTCDDEAAHRGPGSTLRVHANVMIGHQPSMDGWWPSPATQQDRCVA
jgi:hypothetical protein